MSAVSLSLSHPFVAPHTSHFHALPLSPSRPTGALTPHSLAVTPLTPPSLTPSRHTAPRPLDGARLRAELGSLGTEQLVEALTNMGRSATVRGPGAGARLLRLIGTNDSLTGCPAANLNPAGEEELNTPGQLSTWFAD
jgi:hypothetical protein